MIRVAWRIAAEMAAYPCTDLSGAGAAKTGGRWNPTDIPAVYASLSVSTAYLETIVHFGSEQLPANRFLVRLEIPETVFKEAAVFDPKIDPAWNAIPAGQGNIRFGGEWLKSNTSALLIVPSAIVEEDKNVLINPKHPDARSIKAICERKIGFDARVRGAPTGTGHPGDSSPP